ncbi:MAG TPA: BamA/TamA family outer membrane protein [Terriglobales bacterium]|nr:BamA/TamA family outer membrane protein [Terriglobales bacterium]
MSKFPWGRYTSQSDVLAHLTPYVEAMFRKQKLFEMDLPMPTSGSESPPASVPPEVQTITADTLCLAIVKLKQVWPQGRELDLFIANALPKRLEDFGLTMETPLFRPSTQGSCEAPANVAVLTFDIDPPMESMNADKVDIGFDMGAKALDHDGRLLKEMDVRSWLHDNYEKKFWVAKEIKQHFERLYQASGLSPTVIVALSTAKKKFFVVAESFRIGRIRLPASADGLSPDPNVYKIVYSLVDESRWRQFRKIYNGNQNGLLIKAGDGSYLLCLPQLDGKVCSDPPAFLPNGDEQQRSLEYLTTFWMADRGAALQSLGYGLGTQQEDLPPVDNPEKRTSAVDLVVQKLATSTGAATPQPTPTPTPSPNPVVPVATTPGEAQITEPQSTAEFPSPPAPPSVASSPEKPGKNGRINPAGVELLGAAGQRIAPLPAGAPNPQTQARSKIEYAVGVQYRSNQALRFLLNAQTIEKALGPSLLSASGQVGTDGAHPIGNGNINLDWLWFEKLGRRLSLQGSGSSDATAKRLLGGQETDERRVGGNLHGELELRRDDRGFQWSIFAEPRRESVSLSRKDTTVGKLNLNTIKLGSPFTYEDRIALHPMRIMLDSEVRTGSSGASSYVVFTVDEGLHRRVSNDFLISVDLAGHFQAATLHTPITEVPSLGGSETLRGFRTDDALGRRLWSLQSEVWTPIPGTLDGSDAIRDFLRRNVRLAAIFDFGAVSATDLKNSPGLATTGLASRENILKSPGLGIRFIQGLVALKFDWAYGFGTGISGPGHGRFTISVSRNGAF